MKLIVVELDLQWPEEVSFDELRAWVIDRLSEYGDPLRWAITAINFSRTNNLARQLRVEAVVISS